MKTLLDILLKFWNGCDNAIILLRTFYISKLKSYKYTINLCKHFLIKKESVALNISL